MMQNAADDNASDFGASRENLLNNGIIWIISRFGPLILTASPFGGRYYCQNLVLRRLKSGLETLLSGMLTGWGSDRTRLLLVDIGKLCRTREIVMPSELADQYAGSRRAGNHAGAL